MRGGLSAEAPGASGLAARAARAGAAPGPRADALLYVVLGVILTAVWRWHDFVPAARALRPSILLTVLGLALLAADRDPARRLSRLRSPVVSWLAVIGALMLLGIPFSLNPDHSARFFANAILPYVLAGFLVAASIRNVKDIEWLALGTLVGGVVHTALLHATRGIDPVTGRWGPLVQYDANELALMLVSMLPLTLFFMRRGNSAGRRLFAAACFVFFAYSVVKTGSRGGLVGLAAVLGYLFLGYTAVSVRMRVAGAIASAILLAAGGEALRERAGTILRPTEDYNWQDETGRLALWRRGLTYVDDRPVLGLGLDSFRHAEAELSPVARSNRMAGRGVPMLVAHNMFIHVAAELGLPALVAFVALLVATARALSRIRRRYDTTASGDDPAALARALIASLVGFCVCGLFLSVAYFPYLQVLFGLTLALGALAPEPVVGQRRARIATRGAYGLAGDAQSRAVL
jgi:O-antigen ligase